VGLTCGSNTFVPIDLEGVSLHELRSYKENIVQFFSLSNINSDHSPNFFWVSGNSINILHLLFLLIITTDLQGGRWRKRK
jgi:hypothetical protein